MVDGTYEIQSCSNFTFLMIKSPMKAGDYLIEIYADNTMGLLDKITLEVI